MLNVNSLSYRQNLSIATRANIRSGPGTTYGVVKTIDPLKDNGGTYEFLVTETITGVPSIKPSINGEWVYVYWARFSNSGTVSVRSDYASGWMHQSVLSTVTTPSNGSGAGTAGGSNSPSAKPGEKGEYGIPGPFGDGFDLPDWLKGLPGWLVLGAIAYGIANYKPDKK
jgi:hypothetical protein